MKKLLIILTLLFSTLSFAQKVKADVFKYKSVTTAQRDAYVVPAGEFWRIYHSTLSQFEYWNGVAWVVFSAGSTPKIFEKELTNAENNINVGFNLVATTVVFYNGKSIPNALWSGEGTAILNLSLDTKQYDKITVKN